MPTVEFEPMISEGKRPKTYAVDRTATGTDTKSCVGGVKLLLVIWEKDWKHETESL
jgi:hypothetical protein